MNHNWLAFKINNQSFAKLAHLICGKVIDLGCGTAPYKRDIQKQPDFYLGVDWPDSLHSNADVDVWADLNRCLPFRDVCADTVTLFQVLEHIAEPQQLLVEINQILKPGGHLIITVPFMWHVHEAPHDYYRYTRYGLLHLLEKSGFKKIKIIENTGFWQMWILKFNYHTTRFARGITRFLWIPIWWIGQTIAPFLDRYDFDPQETGSYSVVASKL